ncbi:MAG: DUF11 domain-containing protein, partial [Lachnoclostridium sp.]|nr:DUF11 domain-containing protein [Lachnoclostridium sp.]
DALPQELRCVGHSLDQGQTWHEGGQIFRLGNLAADSQKTIQIKGIACACNTSSFTNSALVTSQTPDLNTSNNQSSVTLTIQGN